MNKKIKKLAQIIAALSMSVMFALPFTACSNTDAHTHADTDGDKLCDSCGSPMDGSSADTGDNGDGEDKEDPDKGDGEGEKDPDKGDEGDKKDPDPEVPVVPEGAVVISEAAGDLEACYAVWSEVKAKSYNVYVKSQSGEYTQIDGELVRKYPTYYRADAIGLAAGNYTMKVVPVGSDGVERTTLAATKDVKVEAHDRSGFGFVNGTSSGAYNENGTLREGARVIYITQNTKNTVELEVTGANENPCVGVQAILNGYTKCKDSRPLCVRFIGDITDPAALEKGDLLVDGAKAGVTLEGVGSDANINGFGIRIKGSSNVEVRNLGFMNCNSGEGDNIGLQQDNDHIWVHNNDLFYGDAGSDADQVKGDGALDTKTSKNITHSYNHFWDNGKCNLQGMKKETTDNTVTYHHNWYDHSDSRHPRIRTCTVHIYNNYFDGNAKYGVGVTYGASAFVENNYFRSTATMKPMLVSNQGTDALGEGTFSGEDGGVIKAYGNYFEGKYSLLTQKDTTATNIDCYEAAARDDVVSSDYKSIGKNGVYTYNNFDTAEDMYEYVVDTPEVAKAKIEKWAGRVGGGDIKFDFDDEKEDANYIVIPELKAMLTNYSSTLLEIGGVKVEEVGGPVSGGGSGDSGDNPVTGGTISEDITYIPSEDGYMGKGGIVVTGGNSSSNKSVAVTINGVNIAANSALKLDSNPVVKFTLEEEMTVTVYFMISSIKVDGVKLTATAENNYYVYTAKLGAGEHTITKDSGENAIYMIVITK